MAKKDWDFNGVWDKALPELGEKSRENLEISGRGSIRMKKGLFHTNKEFEKERKKVIKMKIP